MMDANSHSNVDQLCVDHIHLDWVVDFARKTINGSVTLTATTLAENVECMVLDSRGLNISKVLCEDTGSALKYDIGPRDTDFEDQGAAFRISLPAMAADKGAVVKVRVEYETDPTAEAIQWLNKKQTLGKKHPYLFTQCEPIHARSMLPCQDTPSVKATFSADVAVPHSLVAVMGSPMAENHAQSGKALEGGRVSYHFEQPIAIPSYLICLAVGDLKSLPVSDRCQVWSEPEMVEAAAQEFSNTETFLKAAEEICGRYVWGRYDLLCLPPSFPFGGMENPNLTFVTPTLLAGDGSLTNVVAHEISHSWTGNLVTNRTWDHFWLNEGFTVFIERKILARVAGGGVKGEQIRHLAAIEGYNALKDSVNLFTNRGDARLTSLVVDLKGTNPDDSFSSVPYEKGSNFLWYLETLLGGPEVMDPYLKAHVEKWAQKSVDTTEWKEFFLDFFKEQDMAGCFKDVDWQTWLHSPGMPCVAIDYDETLATPPRELLARWTDTSVGELPTLCKAEDMCDWDNLQILIFLDGLVAKSKSAKREDAFPVEKVSLLDKIYSLSKSRNNEILFRLATIAVHTGYAPLYQVAIDMVKRQGRMKYTRPLYRSLFNNEETRDHAIDTFKAVRDGYHPICAKMISKDLGLTETHPSS